MAGLTVPARSEIKPENTWNAPSVFPSIQAWEAEFRDIEASLPLIKSSEKTLNTGAATLVEALRIIEEVQRRTMKLMVYANMSYSVDTQNQTSAAMHDRVHNLTGMIKGATAFLNPGLLALGR